MSWVPHFRARRVESVPGSVTQPFPSRTFFRAQRQHRETGQPVLTHVFAADMRQAGLDVCLRRPPGRLRIGREPGQRTPAPGSAQVQAVQRAILPSLRSLTTAGMNRVAGKR